MQPYDSNYYSPDELYHYGILGMRWGIRRTPEELGHEILKNEHKQAAIAAKITKMEKKHENNPNRPYRKSEARLYRQAAKLKQEREDLELDKGVAEKRKAALEAKAALKKEAREAKEAKRAQKKAAAEARRAEKEAKERAKLNSHNLEKKPLAEMTDRELADYLNRMANEAKYMQYHPKKRTFMDDLTDFAKKNSGKAVQAIVDVGIDVGKEALKNELKKEIDRKAEKPNSNKKFANKPISEMSDSEVKTYLDRKSNEVKLKNALSGKSDKNSGMTREELEERLAELGLT